MNEPRPLVLIADDDLEILRILRKGLSSRYRVIEAHDGAEALDLALQQRPDCVLLDVMMPELNGWEVARHLRQNPEMDRVGIVMLTAIGEMLNEITSPLYGADDQIDKPFRIDDVLERVDAVIAKRRAGV